MWVSPCNTYSYELTYVFRSLFIFLPIWGGWRPDSIHHAFCSAFLVFPSHCPFSSLPLCVSFPSQKPANLHGHPSFSLEFCRTGSPSSTLSSAKSHLYLKAYLTYFSLHCNQHPHPALSPYSLWSTHTRESAGLQTDHLVFYAWNDLHTTCSFQTPILFF